MQHKKRRQGFTLSELLVVLVVIAVLSAVALPMYNKAMKRSRASDALEVLSLASAKQEAYLIQHDKYADSFNDLAVPVKGLKAAKDTSVSLGHFDYVMQNACVVASRPADKYQIYKNFITQQETCLGEGCDALQGLVPTVGVADGCSLVQSDYTGGSGAEDPCIKNPSLCAGTSQGSCTTGEAFNPNTGKCECLLVCSGGAQRTATGCGCECPASGCLLPNQIMNATCDCICQNGYVLNNNQCVAQDLLPSCPAGQCYSEAQKQCIPKNVCEGATIQKQSCGDAKGTQTRYADTASCPGGWSAWGTCECNLGYTWDGNTCKAAQIQCNEATKPALTQPCSSGNGTQNCTVICNTYTGTWQQNCSGACNCNSGYSWDGSTCVKNPLQCNEATKPPSTKTCGGGNGTQNCMVTCDTSSGTWLTGTCDTCQCKSGYAWDGSTCKPTTYAFRETSRQIAAGRMCQTFHWSYLPDWEPANPWGGDGVPWHEGRSGALNTFTHYVFAESITVGELESHGTCYCQPMKPVIMGEGHYFKTSYQGYIGTPPNCPASTVGICNQKCPADNPVCDYKCVANITPTSGCGPEESLRACFFDFSAGCCTIHSCMSFAGAKIDETISYAPKVGTATLVSCVAI